MIEYFIICKSNNWSPRLKKIDKLISELIKFRKELKFSKKINYQCNMILANNKLIQRLNSKYRKINKPTDVLTFILENKYDKKGTQKICDIFFAAELIKKDAKQNNINFYDHFLHLLIHSFLHINGFVHNKYDDFIKMKNLEVKILKKIGISNPYE